MSSYISNIKSKLTAEVGIEPLAVFRIFFGLLLFFSTARFIAKGWVYELYVAPKFYFKYFGFEWVKVPSEQWVYILFGLLILTSIGITVGAFYRVSSLLFAVIFTYIELFDQTNYLNHYYFVSLMSFIMALLPAHKFLSIDAKFGVTQKQLTIPFYYIFAIQLQMAILYFFAGVAKLNYEWLIEAKPLIIWLKPFENWPVVGSLLAQKWVAYGFSWFGAVYDLSIAFLLWNARFRKYAYLAVVVFHIVTWALFPIGVFPFVMIVCTTIFFSQEWHKKVAELLLKLFNSSSKSYSGGLNTSLLPKSNSLLYFFAVFFFVQVLIPNRFLLYPGKLFWTEQGYRFSWRVMLMEKSGTVFFTVKNPSTGKTGEFNANDVLTLQQYKMMATQPDMILQFAHFIAQYYQSQGVDSVEVYADSYVSLNGLGSRAFVNPTINLASVNRSLKPINYLLPYAN